MNERLERRVLVEEYESDNITPLYFYECKYCGLQIRLDDSCRCFPPKLKLNLDDVMKAVEKEFKRIKEKK